MDDIIDLLLEAREELKRLEHIIYVSLKYTRTVDVIINAMNRLVGIYDLIIEAFLEKAKLDGTFDVLPKSPGLRARRVMELFPEDNFIKKHLTFYAFLKNILNSEYERRREYRRHVTFIVKMANSTAEVNIDNLTNCEKFVHTFYNYASKKILPEEEKKEE